jgi:tetratricopeptide (TPR) repeat protein
LTGVLEQLSAGQETQRTELLTILAEIDHWLLDIPSLRREAGEALRLAEQIGRDDLAARAMMALAQADSSDGQTQASLSHVRRALARAGDAHPTELASGVMLASMLEYWLGHFQDAVESSRRVLDLLLLNFARRGEVGRAERLVNEVAQAVATSQGAHGWLWRLRFATAKGEIALARGAWEEAADEAEEAIMQSRRTGRLKYQARGLEIGARALAALGRVHEAMALLRSAVDLARSTGDPAMFLRAATALLSLSGDDALLVEARARAQAIVQALPDEDLIDRFRAAEAVRSLMR